MGDFVNPSNTASKSPHSDDGGQKVCIVFKLLSFKKWFQIGLCQVSIAQSTMEEEAW